MLDLEKIEAYEKLAHTRVLIAQLARKMVNGDQSVLEELSATLKAEELAKEELNQVLAKKDK